MDLGRGIRVSFGGERIRVGILGFRCLGWVWYIKVARDIPMDAIWWFDDGIDNGTTE